VNNYTVRLKPDVPDSDEEFNSFGGLLDLMPDNENVIASLGFYENYTILMINMRSGNIVSKKMDSEHERLKTILALTLTQDKKYVVFWRQEKGSPQIGLWSFEKCEAVKIFEISELKLYVHPNTWNARVTPDNKWLVFPYDTFIGSINLVTGEFRKINYMKEYKDDIFSDQNLLAISPNGKYIIYTSDDHIAWVDFETGKELNSFKAHDSPIAALTITPDSRYVLTAQTNYGSSKQRDSYVKIWELGTITTDETGDTIDHLAITSDGKHILSSSRGVVSLRNITTGEEISHFGEQITKFAVTPDNKYVVSKDKSDRIGVWDISTGKETKSFGRLATSDVTVTPNGKTVIWTRMGIEPFGAPLIVSDLRNGREKARIGVDYYSSFLITPDSTKLICYSYDFGSQIISVWDIIKGEQIRVLGKNSTGRLAMSPNGNDVVWDLQGGGIIVSNIISGTKLRTIKTKGKDVTSLSMSSDGRHVVWGTREGQVIISNIDSGQIYGIINLESEISSLVVGQDNTIIAGDSRGRVYMLQGLKEES
jgi:WD40 repeat protein